MTNDRVCEQHQSTLTEDQPPTSYTDSHGRDGQYWPLTAAAQMWGEALCNQPGCDHPAAIVGLTDVLSDGLVLRFGVGMVLLEYAS